MADDKESGEASVIDLHDGGRRVSLRLHNNTKRHVTFGLTVADQLTSSSSRREDTAIVVQLFSVWKGPDGCWLTPERDLPCLVNDAEVWEDTLLSHGSTIYVGEHYLRFEDSVHLQNEADADNADKTSVPPPKPKRLFLPLRAEGAASVQNVNEVSTIIQDRLEDSDHFLTDYDVIEVTPEYEESVISDLDTPQQVASVVASYILRQLMLNTETTLSAEDVDNLFRAFEVVGHSSSPHLDEFIDAYRKQQKVWSPDDSQEPEIDTLIIQLLVNMLMFSLEPVEHNVLWLRLLDFFSRIPGCLPAFISHHSAAVVMGNMAAHIDNVEVQRYTCRILATLALYVPSPSEKRCQEGMIRDKPTRYEFWIL